MLLKVKSVSVPGIEQIAGMGVVVGSEEFIKGLETRLGRRLGPAKRGRKTVPE